MKINELAQELFGEMRDLTKEERESYRKYIESISIPTGINIWDLYEEERRDVDG